MDHFNSKIICANFDELLPKKQNIKSTHFLLRDLNKEIIIIFIYVLP